VAKKHAIRLSDRELEEMFAVEEWAKKFPPILSVNEAAALARVEVSTIYDWSSRGLLVDCARKCGRLQIARNRFVRFLLER